MLKTIPKSSVNRKAFQVYKQWEVTNSEYEVVSASLQSGYFDDEVFETQNGIITHSLYRSLKSKYYNHQATLTNMFGVIENHANLSTDRVLSETVYVVAIPQNKFGEEIKPGSINLQDLDNDLIFRDNSYASLISDTPLYTLVSLDLETEELVIQDNDGQQFLGTMTSFDIQSGGAVLTFGSDTDTVEIVKLDFENSILQTAIPLNFDGLDIDEAKYGNVFYDDGLLVFTGINEFSNYILDFRSTQTIYETEILISVKSGEFNYSQNPSAVQVTLSGSYDFETTAVTNSIPAGTKKIKEVLDIKRREFFSGSIGSGVGTWDDYFSYASIDPTGSYLTTYITTIGLYDESGDMVAVAKLPNPIKNLPDYDVNFIVRFDT